MNNKLRNTILSVHACIHSVLCTKYRTALQVSSALPPVSVFHTEQAMNVYSYSVAASKLLFDPIGHINPSSILIQYSITFKGHRCSVSHFFQASFKNDTQIFRLSMKGKV